MRSSGHREHAVVPFSLPLGLLLDLTDADETAGQYEAGEGSCS